MPQFDLTTASSQIFWLLVVFAVLYLLLWRFVLPGMTQVMETRQKKIDDDLARAERLRGEAESVLADYERALAAARAQAGEQMKAAADAATVLANERIAVFSAALAEKTKAAESRIAAAEKTARDNMRTIAAEAAGLAVRKLIGAEVPAAEVDRSVETALVAATTGARG